MSIGRLFRAKVKHPKGPARGNLLSDGTWVVGELHTECKIPHIHYGILKKQPIDVDTIGHNTGILDTNGNSIYEGDILRVWILPFSKTPDIMVVEWNSKLARYEYLNTDGGGYLLPQDADATEVAGNIYDNPELLKGGLQ